MDVSIYEKYEFLEERHWWFRAKNDLIVCAVNRYASESARIVDVGCGTGGLAHILSRSYDVVGVDMESAARVVCERRGLKVLEGRLPDDLPLEPSSYDIVIASEVVEHVEDHEGAVQALARLLKPGGTLILTVPAFNWLWSRHDDLAHHKRRYTTRELERVVQGAGLSVLEISHRMIALFPLMVAARLLDRGTVADISIPPAPINAALKAIFAAERFLPRRFRVPFGGTVWCVARASPVHAAV